MLQRRISRHTLICFNRFGLKKGTISYFWCVVNLSIEKQVKLVDSVNDNFRIWKYLVGSREKIVSKELRQSLFLLRSPA